MSGHARHLGLIFQFAGFVENGATVVTSMSQRSERVIPAGRQVYRAGPSRLSLRFSQHDPAQEAGSAGSRDGGWPVQIGYTLVS
jgi:hypothetical protein